MKIDTFGVVGYINTVGRKRIEEKTKLSKVKIRNSGKINPENFLWLCCFSGHNLCTSSLVLNRIIKGKHR